jgi:hypothetical protein
MAFLEKSLRAHVHGPNADDMFNSLGSVRNLVEEWDRLHH